MRYKKVRVRGKDYLRFRRFVDEDSQAQAIYQAPDTEAGRASLDRRRKR